MKKGLYIIRHMYPPDGEDLDIFEDNHFFDLSNFDFDPNNFEFYRFYDSRENNIECKKCGLKSKVENSTNYTKTEVKRIYHAMNKRCGNDYILSLLNILNQIKSRLKQLRVAVTMDKIDESEKVKRWINMIYPGTTDDYHFSHKSFIGLNPKCDDILIKDVIE